MTNQQAELFWRDKCVPVSTRFDDPYYSLENGLAETRHVFLGGNDLPARFRPGFHIAELGFGTGLNMLATWQAWAECGQPGVLHFTSFELFPMNIDDIRYALTPFEELAPLAARFLADWDGRPDQPCDLGSLCFTLVSGDARRSVPAWGGRADAWFLDGFSPAKNPELWEEQLLIDVGTHTNPNGTAATYSAAGDVRRRLEMAGFTVSRVAGYGRKRHMTRATLR